MLADTHRVTLVVGTGATGIAATDLALASRVALQGMLGGGP
jgi:hypothetical protein